MRTAPAKRRGSWRNTVATIVILAPVVGYVVYASLTQAAVECDVCIRYAGQRICRTVEGTTEAEAIRGAIDNACGPVAGGVTETVRCTTTPPLSTSCRPLS
jgi:hypothetical protein